MPAAFALAPPGWFGHFCPMQDGRPKNEPPQPVDPNIQIKFTLIFAFLAAIPFVLFYFFGLESKPAASAADIPAVIFRQIEREAGLDFTHHTGAAGEKLLPETMGGGCAFLDFDADGDQDALLVNSSDWPWSAAPAKTAPFALFLNDGRGQFEKSNAGAALDFQLYGMGVAVGDFDNDGFPDLFLTGVGSNRLLRNEGGQRLADITAAAGLPVASTNWSTSAAFFDFDRDGDLDLFVCNYIQWSRELDLSNDYRLPGVGRAYGPPMNFAGTFPMLYRNDGGRFTEISGPAGLQKTNRATGLPLAKSLGVAPVDLDGDGWLDLVVANDTVQNFVFHNDRNGRFSEIGGKSGVAYDPFGSARGAMGIDTARLYDDDRLAISIGNFANESTALYIASQDPLFFTDEALAAGIGAPTRTRLTFGVFFFDYDLDGLLDLLTVNGHIEPEISKVRPDQQYAQSAQLFWSSGRGLRQGGFSLVPEEKCGADLYAPMPGRGSAFADIDGDGDLDVLMTQVGGPPRLLRNEQALGRHWLRLQLAGTKSNRDAIGAVVSLKAGERLIVRQVMPTRGYLSQSELPLTFGLGSATEVQDVRVTWPDGSKETLTGLKIDSLNRVTQR